MSLTFNRPANGRIETRFPWNGLGLAAVTAMLALAACTLLMPPEQSLAIAIALLILLVAAADLRTGFLVFVVFYPLIPMSWGVDIAEWMPYLSAKRLCCIVLILVFLPQSKAAWDTPHVRKIALFLICLAGMQVFAGFVSSDPQGAVKRTFGDVVEMYLPFLMAAHLFRTKAQLRKVLTLVLVSMGIVAVLGIFEHAADYNFYDSFVATRDDIQGLLQIMTEVHRHGDVHARRVRVAFTHPIELGLHLMCVCLMVIYFLRQRGLVGRIMLSASLPVFALALMYTYSRGPLLGMACGLVWLGLTGKGVRSLLPVILIACVVGFLLMPSQSRDVLRETIISSTDLDSGDSMGGGSVRARLNLFQVGLQLSRQNIWFGLGPNGVRQQSVTYGGGYKMPYYSVDNYYLQTLLLHGAFVLAFVMGLYLYLLYFFTRAALRLSDPELALLGALAAAICVANYIALITVGFNITLFWILLGPAFRLCHPEPTARGQRRGCRSRTGGGIEAWSGSGRFSNASTLPTAGPVGAAGGRTDARAADPIRVAGA
jgi:hypothetical protein